MKPNNIVEDLKIRYSLATDSYFTESAWKGKPDEDSILWNMKIQDLWKDRVETEWYGFDLTNNLPETFYIVIDEFLQWVENENPKFKILQIKLKYGQIRINLQDVNQITKRYILELEKVLTDKHLIY